MSKSRALHTFALVSVSVAATMVFIQACGGGGGGNGGFAFAAPGDAASTAVDPIVGVWESASTGKDCSSGAVLGSFKGFGMFNVGGTASYDNSRPPTSQSATFGTWKRESGNNYALTLVFMRFNPDGTFAGTQKAKVARTLSDDGNSYTSTISGEVIDTTGKVVSTYCATDTGARVGW